MNKAITLGTHSKITCSMSLCSCSYHRQTAPTAFPLWLSSHMSFLALNTCRDPPVSLLCCDPKSHCRVSYQHTSLPSSATAPHKCQMVSEGLISMWFRDILHGSYLMHWWFVSCDKKNLGALDAWLPPEGCDRHARLPGYRVAARWVSLVAEQRERVFRICCCVLSPAQP